MHVRGRDGRDGCLHRLFRSGHGRADGLYFHGRLVEPLRQQRCRRRLQLEAGRAQGIRCLQREVGRHLQTGQAAILKQRH